MIPSWVPEPWPISRLEKSCVGQTWVRPLKVLYFSRDYSTHDHRFLTALVKSGKQVFYLRLEQRGHTLEDRPVPDGVEQVRWAGGTGMASLRRGLHLLLNLRQVLQRIKPDVVLAGPIQRSALLAAMAGVKPLVSMSWGYDLLHDARRSKAWAWATRYTLRRSRALVGDCDTIRRLAVSYGMHPDRIVTFPWGVDLEHFHPGSSDESRPEGAPFTLLSTRGWEPIYGVELIAKAFVQASKQLSRDGGPELRLTMTGSGSLASRLRDIFLKAGLMDQVQFPGQVGFAALPRIYRSADLYISASHSDGSSISLLEAMACGCPVLVSDIPGNREWVTPGEQGWWFPDGDAEALCRGILQAVASRSCLPEMGLAARATAEERANWEVNFPLIFTAFEMAKKPLP